MEPSTMAQAGAAGLSFISDLAERKRKERQAEADAENTRRQKLMSALSDLGKGIGSKGM